MMRLAHPEYLHLLWIVVICSGLIVWSHRRWKRKRENLGDAQQRNKYLPRSIMKRYLAASILILLAIVFWIVALAQPQYGSRDETVKKSVTDIFLAIDISRSMLAEDIKPNRLKRAKIFAGRFLKEMGSERISIIPFAGHAYIGLPLTTDMNAGRMILESLDENTASTQGTAISEAINLVLESVSELEPRKRIMVIITDGESWDNQTVAAARKAADAGITIFTVGVGTEEGGKIPTPNNSNVSYLRNKNGEVVITRYNPELLSKIASSTGGKSYQILSGNRIITDIRKSVNNFNDYLISSKNFNVKNEYYFFFVIGGILCIVIALYLENNRKTKDETP